MQIKPISNLSYAQPFSGKWVNSGYKPSVRTPNIFKLNSELPHKAWQGKCFEVLRQTKNFIIKAVPGAGKSLMAVFLFTDRLIRYSYHKKVLVVTPQKQIAKSFTDPLKERVEIEGESYSFATDHQDYCSDSPSKRKELGKFLTIPVLNLKIQIQNTQIQDRVAIATHANFISVWEKFSSVDRIQAVKDLILIIDECHHANYDDNAEMTYIGKTLNEILSFNDASCEIGLMTATYFRHDSKNILSDKYRSRFKKFTLDWAEYYPTLGIKEFLFYFVFYKTDPVDLIVNAIKLNPNRHHLIILPHLGSRFRNDKTLNNYIDRISTIIPKDKILDVVTELEQERNFNKLNRDKTGTKYQIVICCDKFNEGTDWPPCDWIHNTTPGESLPRLYQINGRAYRAFKGKETVTVTNYFMERKVEANLREVLSDYFNALMVSMMVDEMFCPIYLPVLPGVKKSFHDLLYEDMYRFIADLVINHDIMNAGDNKEPSHVRSMVEAVIDQYWETIVESCGSAPDKTLLVEGALHLLLRASRIRKNGSSFHPVNISPVDISILREDFDKIWKQENPLGSIIFGTDQLPPETFMEFRNILEQKKGELKIGTWKVEDSSQKTKLIHYLNAAPIKEHSSKPIDLTGHWVWVEGRKNHIGRVLYNEKGEYKTRIYYRAVLSDIGITIRCKKYHLIFNEKHSIWVLKNLSNQPIELMKKGPFKTEEDLLKSGKAEDILIEGSNLKLIKELL